MRDFITAIMGGKHCGWCTDKPYTRLERLFNGTGPRKEQPFLRRCYWRWMDFNHWLHVWWLGAQWHLRYHQEGES